ncbi:hypothetical protein L2E82_11375 [Cichorium intybus]|uniref:Uncharacterized protein n=1 Tax=Cichorium intybus TaxID=13427 RepID=A0ACB9GF44_CICIN|nr:hypothetical protein L2E82_11375 [Cichorium intybus]
MWLSRKNSFNRSPTSPRSRTPTSNFNRHSFKNIEDLLGDDDLNVSTTNDLNNDHQHQLQNKKQPSSPTQNSPNSPAGKRHSVFHRVRLANQFTRSLPTGKSKPVPEKSPSELNNASPTASPTYRPETSTPTIQIPGAEKRIVVYMTSLRVVRPTFEACRTVRSILQGFLVKVDERDLSMDPSFKDELEKIMSEGGGTIPKNKVPLPSVFLGGSYLGDAEDVRELCETGELKKLVERLPAAPRRVCEGCGDFRFIICNECNGSRKCYKKKGGFRSCTECNKNGLIRCSSCWTVK